MAELYGVGDSYEVEPMPRVRHSTLLGVTWTLCGAASALVIARLTIRWRYLRGFFIDDYLTILSLVILIANAGLVTSMAPTLYKIALVDAARKKPDRNFDAELTWFQQCQFAFTFLFWTDIWIVKASFLAFFFRLTGQLKWPRRAWWGIAITTALTYIGCVMILPISLTIGLKMSIYQKLGLIGVLCLGCIIAIFALIRAVVNGSDKRMPELSWFSLWTIIESSIAVIVVCLASFKLLFNRKKASNPYSNINGGRLRPNCSSRATSGNFKGPEGVINSIHAADETELDHIDNHHNITVTRSFAVSTIHKMPTLKSESQGSNGIDTESQEIMLN
ncbi:hypothetical protein F5B20DRAFT_591437 [Whalleya microplaca]|nr:hypothetical protein F5B20DRAFT_591437 [Whalleya microplaca]